MAWTLAHNLASREATIKGCYQGIVVYAIGDQKHQSENSDHNPDTRGIVHAIDVMTYGNETRAKAVLKWVLSDPKDIQYVIHDRLIYGRDEVNGWNGSPYHGSDPHTDHVHISGKHGSTGKNRATGTGYDTTAEKMTPSGSPCGDEDDMPTADEIVNAFITAIKKDGVVGPDIVKAQPAGPRDPKNTNGWSLLSLWAEPVNREYVFQQGLVNGLVAQIAAAIAPKVTGLTEAQIQEAVASEFTKAFQGAADASTGQ